MTANTLLKKFFWIAFAVFLLASISHVAYFFRAFEPQDSSLYWWLVAYAIAISVDVTIFLLSMTVAELRQREVSNWLVGSVWVFIAGLALLSWYINWQYAVEFASHMLDRPASYWLVGMINPIIASCFQVLAIAYTWISDKIAQSDEQYAPAQVQSRQSMQIEEEQPAMPLPEIAAISPSHESAREGKIYQLVDPRTDKPFYVGQAKYRIEERFHDHLISSVNPFKKAIINELQKEGLQPRVEMLETVPWDALNEREQYWMDTLREEGRYLTNMQPAPLSTTSTEQTRRKLTDERLLQFIAMHPEMKQKEIAQQLYVSESRISRLLKKQIEN